MSFLKDLARAHQRHEGWYEASLSWRNNNPGNLRLTNYQRRAYGAEEGAGRFARFPNYELGFLALMDDIRAKITGHSAHINYDNNPTFLDYIKVYAPSDDGNNPNGYTMSLIRQLQQYQLSPSMPLSHMARLIQKDKPIIRTNALAQIRSLTRGINRSTGKIKDMLLRRMRRLKKRLLKQ